MFFSRAVGLKYVSRGDIAIEDFTIGDFTVDDAWHNLDLASIIPANAKLIHLQIYIKGTDIGSQLRVDPAGYSNHYTHRAVKVWTILDTNRKSLVLPLLNGSLIQYRVSGADHIELEIDVIGWYI